MGKTNRFYDYRSEEENVTSHKKRNHGKFRRKNKKVLHDIKTFQNINELDFNEVDELDEMDNFESIRRKK